MTPAAARRGFSEPPPSRRTHKSAGSPLPRGRKRVPFPVDVDRILWDTPKVRSMTPARYPVPQVWKIDPRDQTVLISQQPVLMKESAPVIYQPNLKRGETLHSLKGSSPPSPTTAPSKKIVSSIVNVSVDGWRVPVAQLQNYSPVKGTPLQNIKSGSPSPARPLLQNTSPARVERCCSRGRKTTIPLFTDIGDHEAIRDLCPQFEDEGAISDLSSVEQVGSDCSSAITFPEAAAIQEGSARSTPRKPSISPATSTLQRSPQTHMFSEIIGIEKNITPRRGESPVRTVAYKTGAVSRRVQKTPERTKSVYQEKVGSDQTRASEQLPTVESPDSTKQPQPVLPFKNETSEFIIKKEEEGSEDEIPAEELVATELNMDNDDDDDDGPKYTATHMDTVLPGISVTPMHSRENIVTYEEDNYMHPTTPRIDGLDPNDDMMPGISVTPTNSNLGTQILPAMKMNKDSAFAFAAAEELEPTTPKVLPFGDVPFSLVEPTDDDLEPTTPTLGLIPKDEEEVLEPTTPIICGSVPPQVMPSELDLEETYRTLGDCYQQEYLEPTTPTIFGSISDIQKVDSSIFKQNPETDESVTVPTLVITSDTGISTESVDKEANLVLPHDWGSLQALCSCHSEVVGDADVLNFLFDCRPKESSSPRPVSRKGSFAALSELMKGAEGQLGEVLRFLYHSSPDRQTVEATVPPTSFIGLSSLRDCDQSLESREIIQFLLSLPTSESNMSDCSALFALVEQSGLCAEDKKVLKFLSECGMNEFGEGRKAEQPPHPLDEVAPRKSKSEPKPLTTGGMQLLRESTDDSLQKQILNFLHFSQFETPKKSQEAAVFATAAATGLRRIFNKKSVRRGDVSV